VNPETLARHTEQLNRQLGQTILSCLQDQMVTEIMVNPDGMLWIKSHHRGMERVSIRLEPSQRESVLTTVASLLGTVATKNNPLVNGELPFTHHRFSGSLPPVSEAPTFTIRKHVAQHLTIDDYVRDEVMTAYQAEVIYDAIDRRDNILISGGTDSGKTTLLNAVLTAVAERDPVRVVVIEDTRELHCGCPNVVSLHTSDSLSLKDLVKHSLRQRPDRIVIGEVRGAEALDLLKAWNTGHKGGLSSLHANSVASVFLRLQTLVAENAGYVLPPALFAEAVNVLIHIELRGQSRKVTEIARVVPSSDSFQIVPICQGDSL
jgi:type IV secretion system protein VirB11